MKVSEWVAQLKALDRDDSFPRLDTVLCDCCLRRSLAVERDSHGEWQANGWRFREDRPKVRACSSECASQLSALAMRNGEPRPKWVLMVGQET